MADTNSKQISTAEAAWSADSVEALETFLQTKVAKMVKGKDGAEKEEQVLPSPPNIGANVSAEWQYKMLHHPIAREHTEYQDELARISRYGAWLVIAEYDGALKVPQAVVQGFKDWYKSYEDQRSAALSVARQGAKVANEEKTKALGALNAQQQRVAQMLRDGLITQELADAILGAAS